MKTIAQLKYEQGECMNKMKRLLDTADDEGRALTDIEDERYKALDAQFDSLKRDIMKQEGHSERRQKINDANEVVNPFPVGAHNREDRSISGDNARSAKPWNERRSADIPGYRPPKEGELSDNDWFRCLITKDYGPLRSYRPEERGAVLSSGVPGGFLIPEKLTVQTIDSMIARQGIFSRINKQFTDLTDTLNVVSFESCDINEHGLYGFSRPVFVGESQQIPEGEARFVTMAWSLKKLIVSTKFSLEIGSVVPDISSRLSEAMALVLNWGVEYQILNAAGVGIINHASSLDVNRAGAGGISYTDILSLYSKTRLQNPLWIVSQTCVPALGTMVDSGNHAVWISGERTGAAGPVPPALLGAPIQFTLGQQPRVGNKGDIILASDLSYYKAVIFRDLMVQMSDSAHWSTGEIGLRVYIGSSPLDHVLPVSITYWTSREISVFSQFFSGDYRNPPVRKGEGHAHTQGFQQVP